MAAGKLTPRQKMINMMYLVLTALLALNVTKEVINAFVTINQSVLLSKNTLDKKNQTTYAAFEQAMRIDAEKYKEVNQKATAIRKEADAAVKFIGDLKDRLFRETDHLEPNQQIPPLTEMERKDDYDTPTRIMCGEDQNGRGASASEVKGKLDNLKKTILTNLPATASRDAYVKGLDQILNTNDPAKEEEGKRSWEMKNFYHNPVVATIALLTKYQNDVRTAESQVIDELLQSVDKNIVKLDKLNAKVIANSTVVTIGSDYQADVFLSATSSTMAPEVYIGATWDSLKREKIGGAAEPLPVEGGYAKYTAHPSTEGEQKWSGVIRVKKPDGTYDGYPFTASYVAQKPNSVVSADKMNVLYIGVDNPMSISVPGVSNNLVKSSIEGSGGSLKPDPGKGGGHFIANVTTVGKATIRVSAELNGKVTPMGAFEYRVKRVPDPIATAANSKGGPINKSLLAAANIIPVLENFDFELYFKVTGFQMSIFGKGKDPIIGKESPDSRLTQEMRDLIQKARPGDKIFFEYIKAKMATGSDQSTRQLPPLSFTIQ
jgi:gliding motility-associated protein GldM